MKVLLYGDVPDGAADALRALAPGGGGDLVRAVGDLSGRVVDARGIVARVELPADEAARTVARVVDAALPALRAAAGPAWAECAQLVVDGLLLDLETGRRLRATGLTDVDDEWLALLLPSGAATFGMRCVRAGGDVGAGVMWLPADTEALPLPAATDVAPLLHGDVPPQRALRLRHAGWLTGSTSSALAVVAGTPLHEAVTATVSEMLPVVESLLAGAATAPERIALVRRVIDVASDLLGATLPAGRQRRVLWRGTGW